MAEYQKPIERYALVMWLNTLPVTKSIICENELIPYMNRKFEVLWEQQAEPVKLIKIFSSLIINNESNSIKSLKNLYPWQFIISVLV